MRYAAGLAVAVAGAIAVMGLSGLDQAAAGDRSAYSRKAKGGPKVRGYTARGGGYSYTYADTINTYGDSRSRYGATLWFRDPLQDRQTDGGPFDHGFFFDSGVAPRGGNSPYMN